MKLGLLVPFKTALAFFGYLGTVTNGLVLAGFWLCDRSKLTSSSPLIVNHTTLELSMYRHDRFLDLNHRLLFRRYACSM